MKRSRVWIGLLLGLVVIVAMVAGSGFAVGLAQKGIESAGRAAVQQQLQQHGLDRLVQDRDQVQRQMEEQGVHLSIQDDQPPRDVTIRTPGSDDMDATGTCTTDTTSGPVIDMNLGLGGEYRVAVPEVSCNFEDEY